MSDCIIEHFRRNVGKFTIQWSRRYMTKVMFQSGHNNSGSVEATDGKIRPSLINLRMDGLILYEFWFSDQRRFQKSICSLLSFDAK